MDRNVICIKWGTKFGPEYVNKLLDKHPAETYHIYVYSNRGNWLYSMEVRRENAHEIVFSGRVRGYAQYT